MNKQMQELVVSQILEIEFRNLIKGAGRKKEAVLASKSSDTKILRRNGNLSAKKLPVNSEIYEVHFFFE